MTKIVWRGEQVLTDWQQDLANGMGEVGLRVEAAAKRQLYKGHGVLTGTLRRSIHTAPPTYNWGADGGGEMGGQMVPAEMVGKTKLVVSAGSGLEYAKTVHDGHGRFGGYHYMTNAVDIVKPDAPAILRSYIRD